MQEVFADSDNPAYKEILGLNIKSLLVKYRNKKLWKKIFEAERNKDE